jgi:hypothetical protein
MTNLTADEMVVVAREVTESQIHILRHSLGLTRGEEIYRNHYVAGPGSTNFADCCALVDAGYMSKHRSELLHENDRYFRVTDEGKRLVLDLREKKS